MAHVQVNQLSQTDFTTKWGIVEVWTKVDGQPAELLRSFEVSAAKLAEINAGWRPPGITDDDLADKFVITTGKAMKRGTFFVNDDGYLYVSGGVLDRTYGVEHYLLKIAPNDWSWGTGGKVKIEKAIVDQVVIDIAAAREVGV